MNSKTHKGTWGTQGTQGPQESPETQGEPKTTGESKAPGIHNFIVEIEKALNIPSTGFRLHPLIDERVLHAADAAITSKWKRCVHACRQTKL